LDAHGAAVPGIPGTDTGKRIEPLGDGSGRVIETPPREALRAVQTPQAFVIPALLDAHRAAVPGMPGPGTGKRIEPLGDGSGRVIET
ncbi:2-C-methyl-D-erythritol 4-phosphate cytidylyltransferase, partial [Acinetobacter baumannii]|uniref:2-C-methyl-D-erythritol 4-phosphate cytidylyltransferase n=1 Tax=Acinetobacter baumannii TaxID=470 RepID=UPI000D51287A